MSSNTAPYATMHDLPKYEKRADAVSAPWFKDQPDVHCGRGHDPEPYITCNSQTAPFATFHNLPPPQENVGAVSDAPWERAQPPVPACRGSQPLPDTNRTVTPENTSHRLHRPPQTDKSKVHEAPWDRDDVHYKVTPRFPHGEDAPHYTSAHAPYATDSK